MYLRWWCYREAYNTSTANVEKGNPMKSKYVSYPVVGASSCNDMLTWSKVQKTKGQMGRYSQGPAASAGPIVKDSPGTNVACGEGCEASRQLRGSQYDKTLQPPAWDTKIALEKLYWAFLEPSGLWVRPRSPADPEEEEGTELLPAWAIRDLSSYTNKKRRGTV